MVENFRAISWEAPEHQHIEKTTEWYWILGILAIAGSVASIIFGNVLFGLVIILGAVTMILTSHRLPKLMHFEVSIRGIRIEDKLYPFGTLESFCIDEEKYTGAQLIVKSKHLFMPLMIIPIPHEYIDEIEYILIPRLHAEHLEEPFAHRLMEFLGF